MIKSGWGKKIPDYCSTEENFGLKWKLKKQPRVYRRKISNGGTNKQVMNKKTPLDNKKGVIHH